MRGSDVDEVLVVQLVVFSEEVHVSGDLRGPCSLHDQSQVGGQRGLVAGVVQRRAGPDLRVEPQVRHSVLAELDRHLVGSQETRRRGGEETSSVLSLALLP